MNDWTSKKPLSVSEVKHVQRGYAGAQFSCGEQSVPPPGSGRLPLFIFTLQALKCCPDRRHQLITAVYISKMSPLYTQQGCVSFCFDSFGPLFSCCERFLRPWGYKNKCWMWNFASEKPTQTITYLHFNKMTSVSMCSLVYKRRPAASLPQQSPAVSR